MKLPQWELYKAVLLGDKISNKLTDWERAIVLSYAENEINRVTKEIHRMVQLEPGTTFEYWAEKHRDYFDALYVKAILINPPRVIVKRELSLYYYYANIPINRRNCDIIAKKHDLKGEKLRQDYCTLSGLNHIDRTTPGLPGKTPSKPKMIEQYKNVIEGLRENNLDSTNAENDLKIIKDSA